MLKTIYVLSKDGFTLCDNEKRKIAIFSERPQVEAYYPAFNGIVKHIVTGFDILDDKGNIYTLTFVDYVTKENEVKRVKIAVEN